jgi:hypothetical protein
MRYVLRCAVTAMLVLVAGAARAGGGPPTSGPGAGHGNGRGAAGTSSGKGRVVIVLPDGTLRELCTSFTQVTESPFSLGEGQLEVSAGEVSASAAKLDTIRSRSLDVGDIGFARGYANRWTLAATLDVWSGLGLTSGPATGGTTPGGFGGGSLAARHTLFGVDSTGMAMGLVATLTLPGSPTSPQATAYGAALALPFAASLPFDFSLGAMAEVARLADAVGSGHHVRYVDSLKLDRSLARDLSTWVEMVSIADQEPGYPWTQTMNAGLSVDLGRHVGLSLGVAAGRAHKTTDQGVFGGVAFHL